MLIGILLMVAGGAGWGEEFSSLNRALSSVPRFLARSWDRNSGITAGFEPACALDGDVNTYWASNAPTQALPKEMGVEWERPVSLRGCAIAYVVQSGISYAPHREGYRLEAWQGGRWQEVAHETRERLASAPAYGLVWWEHRFAVPVRTTRLRVVVTRAEQRPAIAEWVLEGTGSGSRAVSWDEQGREHSLGTMSGLNDGDLGRLVEVHGRPHGLRWEVPQQLRYVALWPTSSIPQRAVHPIRPGDLRTLRRPGMAPDVAPPHPHQRRLDPETNQGDPGCSRRERPDAPSGPASEIHLWRRHHSSRLRALRKRLLLAWAAGCWPHL